jgi:hypothetical protein
MRKIKLPKELRLAYLIHLLHKRMQNGKGTVTVMSRHYRLVVELEREKAVKFITDLEKRYVA